MWINDYQRRRFFLSIEWRDESILGFFFFFLFEYTIQRAGKAIDDNGRKREREREKRGRFSRDECSVIATREGHGAPCQGIPASLSFSLPPSLLFHAQSKLAPNEALGSVHYRCIAAHPSIELFDAASKQPPLPSSSSFGIYIDEYDACPDSRVNLSLSLRFFFPLNGHRNFFPSRVEQVPFILPPAHLSTCRKGEAFRSDGGRGGEKKCRSV